MTKVNSLVVRRDCNLMRSINHMASIYVIALIVVNT